jgi:tetratricopeptide (TPR) repeat protein
LRGPSHSTWKLILLILALATASAGQLARLPGLSTARALVESGKFSEAVAVCRGLIEREPNSPDVHIMLGIAYAALGDRTSAAAALRNAIELDPSQPAPYANLGIVYMDQRQMERAAEALEQAVTLGDRSWSTRYNLALSYVSTEKLAAAKSVLEHVVGTAPIPEPRLELASVLLRLGDVDGAVHQLRQLDNQPLTSAVHEKAGLLLLKHSQYEEAARHLALIVDRHPERVPVHLQLAEAYVRSGNYADAIETLSAIPGSATPPQMGVAHYLAATAHDGLKEELRALDYYEKAVAADPKELYYVELIKALLRVDAMEDALHAARLAEEKYPESVDVLQALGSAALVNLVSDEAIRAYQKILTLEPANEDARLQLGNVYLAEAEFSKAEEVFNSVSRQSPRNEQAPFGLALVLIRQGKNTEAKQFLEKTAKLNPRHAGALYHLGKIHYSEQQYGQALGYLKRSVAETPEGSEDLISAHYQMGMCYLKLGDKENARKHFAIQKQLRARQPAP